MGSQEKEMISKIKARRDDYYSKSLNAELRKERVNKNHEVLNHVINELNARSSELTWVLELIEHYKYSLKEPRWHPDNQHRSMSDFVTLPEDFAFLI